MSAVGIGAGCTMLWMLIGTMFGADSSISWLPLQAAPSRQHARSTAGFFKHVSPSTASSHDRRLPSPERTGQVAPGQSVSDRQPLPALRPPLHLPFCWVMRASIVHDGPPTLRLPQLFLGRSPQTPPRPSDVALRVGRTFVSERTAHARRRGLGLRTEPLARGDWYRVAADAVTPPPGTAARSRPRSRRVPR